MDSFNGAARETLEQVTRQVISEQLRAIQGLPRKTATPSSDEPQPNPVKLLIQAILLLALGLALLCFACLLDRDLRLVGLHQTRDLVFPWLEGFLAEAAVRSPSAYWGFVVIRFILLFCSSVALLQGLLPLLEMCGLPVVGIKEMAGSIRTILQSAAKWGTAGQVLLQNPKLLATLAVCLLSVVVPPTIYIYSHRDVDPDKFSESLKDISRNASELDQDLLDHSKVPAASIDEGRLETLAKKSSVA